MRVRITCRVELYVEGNTPEEAMGKFGLADMGDCEFVEMVSVEDADTGKDLSDLY